MFVHVVHIPTCVGSACRATMRDVVCERCARAYRYRMVRRAEATAIGNGPSSLARARRHAERKLDKLLQTDHDPVPCPKCGRFQHAMVLAHRRFRAGRCRQVQNLACIVALIGGLLVLAAAADASDMFRRPFTFAGLDGRLKMAAYLCAAAGAVLWAIYLVVRRGWDVNDGGGPLPNMPRALPAGAPAPNPPPAIYGDEAIRPDGWVTVQLLDVRFPPRQCAECLGDTSDHGNGGRLGQIPWCKPCRRASLRKQFVFTACGAIAAALVTAAVMLLPVRRIDADWLSLTAIFAVMAMAGVGLVVLQLTGALTRPVRTRRFISLRNMAEVRFRSPQYADAFIRLNRPAHRPAFTARA
jgi:hypothetical protein